MHMHKFNTEKVLSAIVFIALMIFTTCQFHFIKLRFPRILEKLEHW